jgi:hypothetical protein
MELLERGKIMNRGRTQTRQCRNVMGNGFMINLKNRALVFGATFAAAMVAGTFAAQATTVPPGDLGGFSINGVGDAGLLGQAMNITTSTSTNLANPEDNIYLSNDTFSTTNPFSISFDYGVSGAGISPGSSTAPTGLNGTVANFFLGNGPSSTPGLEFTINPYASSVSYYSNPTTTSGNSGGAGGNGGTGGSINSDPSPSNYTITTNFLYTGSIVGVALSYDPTTTTLQEIISTSTGQQQTFSYNIDLATTLGVTTNFGFEGKTGGTPGTAYQQTISNFNYADSTTPVPEPSMLSLFLTGGAGLLLVPYRRRASRACA